ncbi:MAG: flagellar biosynthetic protein FliR [Spirochaetales bacterium]|nr:flagellar biosynthetic protein FliR [Spirochaetales bacterium]
MSIGFLILRAQLFLLIFARIFGLLMVAPMFSSRNIPGIARVGLGLFTAVAVLPWVEQAGYLIPEQGLFYAALILGEAMIGVIMGFLLNVIYSAFQLAGQFFSLQMGFASSQVYDPLAQLQLPLIGQFLNLIAMFVLLTVSGLQKIFLVGVYRSFETVTALTFMEKRDYLIQTVMTSIGGLFGHALLIALPVMGTLFLASVSMGLLAKAAPQMNLLMLGFPINIFIAFLLMYICMPFIMESFGRIIDMGFVTLYELLAEGGGV